MLCTCIISSPWNNYIRKFFCLQWKKIQVLFLKYNKVNSLIGTYWRTKFFKSWFYKRHVLSQDLFQVSSTLCNVSYNCNNSEILESMKLTVFFINHNVQNNGGAIPLRDKRVSESVSTNNFIWNRSRMAGK